MQCPRDAFHIRNCVERLGCESTRLTARKTEQEREVDGTFMTVMSFKKKDKKENNIALKNRDKWRGE